MLLYATGCNPEKLKLRRQRRQAAAPILPTGTYAAEMVISIKDVRTLVVTAVESVGFLVWSSASTSLTTFEVVVTEGRSAWDGLRAS
jgi:hypothetical protein